MTMARRRWALCTLAAALCGATGAFAAPETTMPRESAHGVVRYISGGVGTEEQEAMQRVAPSYPLELQFVVVGDTDWNRPVYTADVGVTIRDRAGQIVLDTTAAGPFMLAWLPGGEYTISAEDDGRVTTRHVRIDEGKHRKIVFAWNG
jgi:hypothetical protein